MWVNEKKTLWSDCNGDTWQLPFLSKEGCCCGRVVAQVVDPQQCLVRYFIVYSQSRAGRFLVPGDSVECIDSAVRCSLPAGSLQKLPLFNQNISIRLEQEIHRALGRTPYWVQETDRF